MKYSLTIAFFAIFLLPHAQTDKFCGFNDAYEKLFKQIPGSKAVFEGLIKQQGAKSNSSTQSASSFTIPVVFHVLHKGGVENISDAQIQDAVAILNRDFRKLNADTTSIVTEFKPLAADCNIEFRLATKDPNGKCTNGITRHYDASTDWDQDLSSYNYTWPPTKYMNIYIVKSIAGGGAAAYTFLPGSVPGNMDAIVAIHGYVGSIGTGNNFVSRVLTHETGHWLNLQHVWGSTNNPGVACGDDGVGDTPLTKGFTNCNLSNAIICTPGIKENIQNYMEYSYCCKMFTQGQRSRMHNALNSNVAGRDNLSSNANLIATGVINPTLNCTPLAAFLQSASITCVGNNIGFTDQSYNAPISSWQWSSNLSAPVSTLQNGILTFTGAGLAQVKLKVTNQFGSDSLIKQIVTVLAGPTGSGNINLSQGFESTFPGNDWIKTVPTQGSAFQQTTLAAPGGSVSAMIDNYFDNPNSEVNIFSPALNLQNAVSSQLSFKYAYAQQTTNNNDRFRVMISNDCGATWNMLFNKTGTTLSTAGVPVTSPFSPYAWQWKTENVDLTPYSGNMLAHIRFEFTPDVNGPGNNFFIDDINLSSAVGMNELEIAIASVAVMPIPFKDVLTIRNNSGLKIRNIQVRDLSSRIVKEYSLNSNEEKIVISDLESLSEGVYFLELNSEKGRITKKIVK